MAFERLEHSGGAPTTALLGDIGSGDTTLTLTSGTNWPTGVTGPFYLVVDPGASTEEKMLATSRSTNTLSGISRGVDGTSQFAHSAGAVIQHVWTAAEADEANKVAHQTLGIVAAKGDILAGTAAQTVGRVQVGLDNRLLVADSAQTTGVRWALVSTSQIANAAITPPLIDTSVVGAGLAGGAGTALSVPVDNATIDIGVSGLEVKLLGITTAQLIDLGVTTAKLGDLSVTTAKIVDASVTAAKLSANALDSRPLGIVRKAVRQTTQNVGTSVEDVQTLTAYTLVTGRNYRVHVHIPVLNRLSAGGRVKVMVRDSTNAFYGTVFDDSIPVSESASCDSSVLIENASGGPITFKYSAQVVTGGGTVDLVSTDPLTDPGRSYILLEDCGNQAI